jgi:alpha-ketoglutarate-dependent taurine dioxygenase
MTAYQFQVSKKETQVSALKRRGEPLTVAIASIKKVLDEGAGSIVLRGFPLGVSESERDARYLTFAEQFGKVTLHGGSRSAIWHVSPKSQIADRDRTFSEMADEAPLHTDSSFIDNPETYFSLLVVRPAKIGGNSISLPVSSVINALRREPGGPQSFKVLSEQKFPFATPAAFSDASAQAGKRDTVFAPIFGETVPIRFRMDCILAGFAACPDLATPERVRAVHFFNDFLQRYMQHGGKRLEAGDLFIGNNHRILHARTFFSDPDRLLLRVRITAKR